MPAMLEEDKHHSQLQLDASELFDRLHMLDDCNLTQDQNMHCAPMLAAI